MREGKSIPLTKLPVQDLLTRTKQIQIQRLSKYQSLTVETLAIQADQDNLQFRTEMPSIFFFHQLPTSSSSPGNSDSPAGGVL